MNLWLMIPASLMLVVAFSFLLPATLVGLFDSTANRESIKMITQIAIAWCVLAASLFYLFGG